MGEFRNPKRHSDEDIKKALDIHRGNVSRAAKALGYHPSALRRRITQTPELNEHCEQVRESSVDLAESILWEHIEDRKSLQACLEYLKAQGKRRGYGSQSIEMQLDANHKHGLDESLLQSLIEKFEKGLEDE